MTYWYIHADTEGILHDFTSKQMVHDVISPTNQRYKYITMSYITLQVLEYYIHSMAVKHCLPGLSAFLLYNFFYVLICDDVIVYYL